MAAAVPCTCCGITVAGPTRPGPTAADRGEAPSREQQCQRGTQPQRELGRAKRQAQQVGQHLMPWRERRWQQARRQGGWAPVQNITSDRQVHHGQLQL